MQGKSSHDLSGRILALSHEFRSALDQYMQVEEGLFARIAQEMTKNEIQTYQASQAEAWAIVMDGGTSRSRTAQTQINLCAINLQDIFTRAAMRVLPDEYLARMMPEEMKTEEALNYLESHHLDGLAHVARAPG